MSPDPPPATPPPAGEPQTLAAREDWEGLYATLVDFAFLERKSLTAGVAALLDDFAVALRQWPEASAPSAPRDAAVRLQTLTTFARALQLESHVLARWPQIVWQQLSNRLRWETGPVGQIVEEEVARRDATHHAPWLRTVRPPRESPALIHTLAGHTDAVAQCVFASDGSCIVSGGLDGTLKVWEARTGRLRATLAGHQGQIFQVALSRDARYAVSIGGDTRVLLWDLEAGQLKAELRGPTRAGPEGPLSPYGFPLQPQEWMSTAIAFSPNGRWIAGGDWGYGVRVWDVETGQALPALGAHAAHVSACAFHPDGTRFLSASADGVLRLWELEEADGGSDTAYLRLHAELTGHRDQVDECAISPDGTWAVSASRDGTLKVWDLYRRCERLTLLGHRGAVFGCAISPDGTTILSRSDDRTLRLWSADIGRPLARLAGHTRFITSCAFDPDGEVVASASQDRTLRLWDARSGALRATLTGHGGSVQCLSFSPGGTRLVSGSEDNTLRVWDVPAALALGSGAERGSDHAAPVEQCRFTPDGKALITASDDTTLKRWDTGSGDERRTFEGHTGWVTSCALSTDGAVLLSGSWDNTARLWDAQTGKLLATLAGHDAQVTACALSADGQTAVTGSVDGTVRVWDAPAGTVRRRLVGHTDSVACCALSGDSRTVASGGRDGMLRLWDAHTGQPLVALPGYVNEPRRLGPDGIFLREGAYVSSGDAPPGWVTVCAFTPDGEYVLSGANDGTVRIWSARLGRAVSTHHGHQGAVTGCAMDGAGRFAVTSAGDGTVTVWDLPNGQERLTIHAHQGWAAACSLSADGRTMATVGDDQALRLWDVATGRERALLPLGGVPECVTLDPAGRMVAAGDKGGNVYLAELTGE